MFDEMDWSGRRLEGGWNESYIDDAEVWKVAVAGFLILTPRLAAAGRGHRRRRRVLEREMAARAARANAAARRRCARAPTCGSL